MTGALAVKAWMRMGSERPLALLLEMETQYPVPGRRPVTVKAGALVLVVLAVKINYIMGRVITRVIRVCVLGTRDSGFTCYRISFFGIIKFQCDALAIFSFQ